MSMNLRDWASIVKEFYRPVPPEVQSTREKMKILGMTWSLTEDILSVLVGNYENTPVPVTKPEVLQRVASIFDPLGFFTPGTLKAKLFLQALWEKNLELDEQLGEEDIKQWKEIQQQI